MSLRAALGRMLGVLFVLFAPLLLWGAAVRGAVQRDVAVVADAQADSAARAAAQARIAALGPPGVAGLIESLGGPTPIPVMNMLRSDMLHSNVLHSRGGPDVVGPLVAALDADDEDLRHYAGMTLALIGPPAVPALIETLATSPVPHVRTSAAWVLSFMGAAGTAALPALNAALADPSQDVRYVARYAIQQLSSGNDAFWEAVDKARSRPTGPR